MEDIQTHREPVLHDMRFTEEGLPEHVSISYAMGVASGTLLMPGLVVGISSFWNHINSQHKIVKVFALACEALLITNAAATLTASGDAHRWWNKGSMRAEDFKAPAAQCAARRDLACQEVNWRDSAAVPRHPSSNAHDSGERAENHCPGYCSRKHKGRTIRVEERPCRCLFDVRSTVGTSRAGEF